MVVVVPGGESVDVVDPTVGKTIGVSLVLGEAVEETTLGKTIPESLGVEGEGVNDGEDSAERKLGDVAGFVCCGWLESNHGQNQSWLLEALEQRALKSR